MNSASSGKKKGALIGRVANIAILESATGNMSRRFAVSTLKSSASGGCVLFLAADYLSDEHFAAAKGRTVIAVHVTDQQIFADLAGRKCKVGSAICRFGEMCAGGRYLAEIVTDGGARLGNSVRLGEED